MGKLLGASLSVVGAALAALLLSAGATGVTFNNGGGGTGTTTTTTGGDGGGGEAGSGGATTTTSSTTKTDGTCVGAADCASFSDACNTGACINGLCGTLPSADGAACDDGKQCTQNDFCQAGKCVGGGLKSCSSSNPCMVGVCDLASDTCQETPGNNGAFCNIGNSCILTAQCISGVCQPSQMVDCSALNTTCGDGFCDPAIGCQVIPKNDGTLCNDNLYCTIQDTCLAGTCKGVPNPCGAPNNPCMIGVCNEAQQTCVATPGNNGASCDDGNSCTGGEACSNGKCVGGAPANNGAACDDQDGCTGGTTCNNGVCTDAQSNIVQCIDGDMCCPAGCGADKDCLWYVPGVQLDVPPSQLTGWTPCYSGLYADFSPTMATILQQCDKPKLLMACRQVGAANWHTLAMAPRVDVVFDTGTSNTPHDANGVGWYYNDSYSLGFAPQGELLSRNSCDTQNGSSEDRICWHSGGGSINGGWRCGAATGLNGDTTWERALFEAD